MKNMNKLTELLETESTDLSLSYSRISDFDRNGPQALIRKMTNQNDGMSHGKIVDILLTDKLYGVNEFSKEYVIFDDVRPENTLGKLCDIILNNYMEVPNKEKVFEIIATNNFWSRTKKQELLRLEFDKPEFWEYLKLKFEIKNKVIVSKEEYNNAVKAVDILLEHSYTKNYFFNKFENIYQYKIEFEYKKFTIRGILDKISIDHKNKIVYMEDIKTGAPKSEEFLTSFIKYRYYLQEAVYTTAFDVICEKLGLKGYTLAPFKFIYISRFESVPVIYEVSEKWHNGALNGFISNGTYKYKGLNQLLDDIYFHWKNKEFELPREIIEKKGNLILKDDFIEVNE